MTPTSDIRACIVAAARALRGTPFHHQGRRPGVGIDCAGVPICVARALGLVEPDFDVPPYGPVPDGIALQALCEQHMRRVTDHGLGDVVLVAWGKGPPQHLGIVCDYLHGGHSMVHAENLRHREVVETRLLFGRAMRLVQAYAFPGVA